MTVDSVTALERFVVAELVVTNGRIGVFNC